MKTIRNILISISISLFILIGCGGDSGNISDTTQNKIYIKNDTFNVKKGDNIKSISADTNIHIITDIETSTSIVTVLSGSVSFF